MKNSLNDASQAESTGDLGEALDRIVHMVIRRRWYIGLPACVAALAMIPILPLLPTRYTSEATLVVVEQKVPERYVTPTTTADIGQELQAIQEEVLSRTRLFTIIEEFGLYPKERKRLAPEEVMALMRQRIHITPLESEKREINAFKISFTTDNPSLAQRVTSRLTSLFIEENTKAREDQANTTTNFLRAELESAKVKLTAQEELLGKYKMGYIGELPEQKQGNLQILSGLQIQLQNTMANLSRAQQQRLYLNSLVQSDLIRLRSERATLLATYTPKHSSVIKIDREIAKKQALLVVPKASQASETTTSSTPSTATGGASVEEALIDPLASQLEANRQETDSLVAEEEHLKAEMSRYEKRVNLTPVREQQLTAMQRDYEVSKKSYEELLNKEQQSQLAMSLEKQQEGQQFRLIDPPSLPTVPTSPKRMLVSLGGLAGGAVLGAIMALLLEFKNHSLRTEKDVRHQFSVPLVVGIPLLRTPFEKRRHTWKTVFECMAASALFLVVMAGEYYVYLHRHG
jgi:polysaccharide chain length determinant protein (PEP-CTERM system associated)